MRDDDDLFAGPGQVAALLREHDWAASPYGPPATWPREWRSAIRIMLASSFPICLTLGSDVRSGIFFHNDAYIPIVAGKFPASMARPAREVWPEIAEQFRREAQASRAVGASSGTDRASLIRRHGRVEQAFFSFSTSPLWGEGGQFMGHFTVAVETTARVLAERRLACLRDLSGRAFDAQTVEEACRRAAEVLGQAADLPAAMLYVIEEGSRAARCVATAGASLPEGDALGVVDLASSADPLRIAEVAHSGNALPLEALVPLLRIGEPPACSGFALPIHERIGDRVGGVLVAAATPLRPRDEVQEFLVLVSAQLATAFTNARAKQHAERRASELAALNRAKTEFLADVSHELRTPLTLLLGPLTELVSAGRLAEADRTLLELARRGASRMKKLINTLLDFSRVEAGRAEPHFEAVDLARETRELAGMFESAFAAVDVRFVIDAEPLAERAYVDREMWEKIVLNLLSNALKFTFEGEVRLGLSAHEGRVRLSVSDTGCGIAEAHLPHVFERFYRSEAARARTREGSGIGLSLVRELVRLHGGDVSIESTLGRGTTIHVDLPLGDDHLPRERTGPPKVAASGSVRDLFRDEALGWLEEAGVAATERSPSESPLGEGEPARIVRPQSLAVPPTRIVLADDSAPMRAYLGRILGERWEVHAVADGRAALALATATLPDLIVSDVMMPGLDGFALIEALRAEPATAEIPVLLVSARAGEEAVAHALARGAADYVVKPFSTRELVARVQVQLTHAQLKQTERAARTLAEHESRARERFLAVLAHELRTPLAAVLGWTQMLQRGALGAEDTQRALAVIAQSAAMQKRLIEDLLDVSRVVAGTLTIDAVHSETLAPLVETVVDSFRVAASDKGIRIEASLDPRCGPVQADAQRIQQVVTNLLSNAVKFTPAGGVVVVCCEPRAGQLALTVRDTGKGIAPDALPHVFDDFWMGSRSEGRHAGLGLGLAITRAIVTLHRGTIRAESEGEGRGTTFTVTLPLAAK